MERDILVLLLLVEFSISTHTLTWSVTGCIGYFFLIITISTHTLTWSVTATLQL